ncbi:MAG: T9SS type A sorting domain-containing protein [Flavobacteriaceae bacterium]|nr:T9SS type A sorting domain-containing protein [Flavobacteriaceae bacterium]MDG2314255.1 T9SS type A sorting domain-containing protein [Flavobacteriaceae bacterium]
MRNVYIFFTIILSATALNAQFSVNFTEAENFADGPLYNQTDWYSTFEANTWNVNTSIGKIYTPFSNRRAAWGKPFIGVTGDQIKFRVEFDFTGSVAPENTLALFEIGFISDADINGGDPTVKNTIYIMTTQDNSFNPGGSLMLFQNFGTKLTGNPKLPIVDCQGDDLALEVTLELGNDGQTSEIYGQLFNLTDGSETAMAAYQSTTAFVSDDLVSAAKSTGVYGFMKSQTITDPTQSIENLNISKVTMSGYTLSNEFPTILEFNIIKNPVQNELGITGLDTGSQISIYSISGAKVHTQEFNGKSINVSNLNAGLYFLETPGYSVKKFLKK